MYVRLFLVILAFAVAVFLVELSYRDTWATPTEQFPAKWRRLLRKHVAFYNGLNANQKKHFEFKVQEFLANVAVTGYETTIHDLDKVLVAASAIIPIFSFPKWQYTNLEEVLIYPRSFSMNFQTSGQNRTILGMVGTGYMDKKMILSQTALRQGFLNETDKKNTAIHEFIHLIDQADGQIDGIPNVLLEKQYVLPWLDLMDKMIRALPEKKMDINPYGMTSRVEFFAVLGEYFFERPALLKQKHPEIFNLLEEIFDQDPHDTLRKRKKQS